MSTLPAVPNPSYEFGIQAGIVSGYAMGVQQLRNLGKDMFSENVWAQLEKWFGNNPPYEAIISLGVFPYLTEDAAIWETAAHSLVIAGITLPTATGNSLLKQVYNVDFKPSANSSGHYIYGHDGATQPPKFDFFDYSPYTTVRALLPFIGWVELDPAFVIGHTVYFRYSIDVFTGGCVCHCCNEDGEFASQSGVCCSYLPLTNSEGGHLIDAITGAAAAGLSLAAGSSITTTETQSVELGGNRLGQPTINAQKSSSTTSHGSSNALANAINVAQHAFDKSVTVRGTFGCNMGYCMNSNVFLVVTRPNILPAGDYGKTVGLPTANYMQLYNCQGFTVADSVKLTGIKATYSELAELENLLKTGVVFPYNGQTIGNPTIPAETTDRVTVAFYNKKVAPNFVNFIGDSCVVAKSVQIAGASVTSSTGAFRQQDSPTMTNPRIIINASLSALHEVNYVYVDNLKRFYWVVDMEAITNDTTLLILHCDVLNSWLNDMKNCYAFVSRQENPDYVKPLLIDNKAVTGAANGFTTDTYTFTAFRGQQNVSGKAAYILIAAGSESGTPLPPPTPEETE